MPEFAVHVRVLVEAENAEAALIDVEDAMSYTDVETYIGVVEKTENNFSPEEPSA